MKVLQTSGEEIGSSNPKTLPSVQPQNEVTICQFHKSDKHALSDCKSFKRLNFLTRKNLYLKTNCVSAVLEITKFLIVQHLSNVMIVV